MAKAATASKAAEHVPKKRAREGDSDRGAPKKGRSAKYCKLCNTQTDLSQTTIPSSVAGSQRTVALVEGAPKVSGHASIFHFLVSHWG
jgi:hypothetical protein